MDQTTPSADVTGVIYLPVCCAKYRIWWKQPHKHRRVWHSNSILRTATDEGPMFVYLQSFSVSSSWSLWDILKQSIRPYRIDVWGFFLKIEVFQTKLKHFHLCKCIVSQYLEILNAINIIMRLHSHQIRQYLPANSPGFLLGPQITCFSTNFPLHYPNLCDRMYKPYCFHPNDNRLQLHISFPRGKGLFVTQHSSGSACRTSQRAAPRAIENDVFQSAVVPLCLKGPSVSERQQQKWRVLRERNTQKIIKTNE